jgi:hypothetical protein
MPSPHQTLGKRGEQAVCTAKRAGWTGFTLMLCELPEMGIGRIYP